MDNEKLPLSANITAVAIDKFLGVLKGVNFKKVIDGISSLANKITFYGFYLAAILGFVGMMVIKVKLKAPFLTMLGIGIGIVLACIIMHYLAYKYLPVVKNIVKAEPVEKFSAKIFDTMAILSILAAIAALLLGLTGRSGQMVPKLVQAVVAVFFAFLCVSSSILNVEASSQPVKGSKQFIAIVAFFMRGYLVVVPFVLCFGVIALNLMIINSMFAKTSMSGMQQMMTLLPFLVAPIISYLIFITYSFFMDIYKAILSLLDRK